jgi:hypothetical protein
MMANLDQKMVDVNRASREELERIPGLGPALAARVTAGRPYNQLADLEKVNGIGANMLKKLLPFLVLQPDPAMVKPPRSQKNGSLHRAKKPALVKENNNSPDVQANLSGMPFTSEGENSTTFVMPEVMVMADEDPPSVPQAVENEPPEMDALDSTPHAVGNEGSQRSPVVQPVIDFISDMAGRVEHVVRRPSPPRKPVERQSPRQQVEHRLAVIPQWSRFDGKPGFDKSEALFWGGGIGVLVFILSVLVTLGVLLGVNGSLSFIPAREMLSIQSKMDGITIRLNPLEEETGSLRQRLDAFESLSGRIKDMEKETQSLRSEMDKNVQEMTGLQDQVKQLNDQVTTLQERSLIFEKFLDKLRTILDELFVAP